MDDDDYDHDDDDDDLCLVYCVHVSLIKKNRWRETLQITSHAAWRLEKVDLIGTATSYKNKYFEIKDIVEGVRCQYEPHADELGEAVHDVERENGLQNAWDEIAPLSEHQETIDEDLQMNNNAAEHEKVK